MTLKKESIAGLLLVQINKAENALLEFEAMLSNALENIRIKEDLLSVAETIAKLRDHTR